MEQQHDQKTDGRKDTHQSEAKRTINQIKQMEPRAKKKLLTTKSRKQENYNDSTDPGKTATMIRHIYFMSFSQHFNHSTRPFMVIVNTRRNTNLTGNSDKNQPKIKQGKGKKCLSGNALKVCVMAFKTGGTVNVK